MDMLQILAEIPGLAAEAFITWDHPNPAPKADRHTRTVPDSTPNLRVDAWDVFRTDHKGDLRLLHGWCISIDEASDSELGPLPERTPTWAGCSRYLAETHHWWSEHADIAKPCRNEIADVWHSLRRLARVRPPKTYPCTTDGCTEVAHTEPGGQWLRCGAGHQVEGIAAARARLQREGPRTAAQIEEAYGVKAATIRQWKARGLIAPVGHTGKVDLWSAWDVLTVQHREQTGALA